MPKEFVEQGDSCISIPDKPEWNFSIKIWVLVIVVDETLKGYEAVKLRR